MKRSPSAASPMTYQIKLQGRLDDKWSEWLSSVAVTHERRGDGSHITVLTSIVPDQAALRGILDRIWDLNLTLLSVTRTETSSEPETREEGMQ
jgi:hypothetical protein